MKRKLFLAFVLLRRCTLIPISSLTACAMCIAFGMILPIAFHLFGAAGSVFLPMHIPVLVGGLFFGAKVGLLTGFITPILSALLTGMPPMMPVLPIMAAELAVYGFTGGFLHQICRLPLLVSLAAAMIGGRLMAAVTVYVLGLTVGIQLQPVTYITGALVTGLPGMFMQILLIPLFIRRLQSVLPNYRKEGE